MQRIYMYIGNGVNHHGLGQTNFLVIRTQACSAGMTYVGEDMKYTIIGWNVALANVRMSEFLIRYSR